MGEITHAQVLLCPVHCSGASSLGRLPPILTGVTLFPWQANLNVRNSEHAGKDRLPKTLLESKPDFCIS